MSDINVTPLVDVMLVLVVIFIITAPLLASTIRLDLPRTDAAKVMEVPRFVTLVVDKSGQAFLNDKPMPLEELAKKLTQTARQNPDTEVQLRADEAVLTARWSKSWAWRKKLDSAASVLWLNLRWALLWRCRRVVDRRCACSL